MTERRRLNIVLVAEAGAGLEMLRALGRSEHHVAMVITSPPSTPGSAIWAFAEKRGYRLLPAQAATDEGLSEVILQNNVDLLLNVHARRALLPSDLVAPRRGRPDNH